MIPGHFIFMNSIETVAKFQNFLSKLDEDNVDTIAHNLSDLIPSGDKVVSLLFIKTLLKFIPARPLGLKTIATMIQTMPCASRVEFKDIFLEYILVWFVEPNQPESCAFFTYLVENNYVEAEKYLDMLMIIFSKAEKLDNIIFVQLLYAIARIGKILYNTNSTKFSTVLEEFHIRSENIKIGANLDDNAEIYSDLYDKLIELKDNNWNIDDSIQYKKLLDAICSDNPSMLSRLDLSEPLYPSLLVPSSVLGFGPPLVSVAAFYGAFGCVKYFVENGFDIRDASDDEGISLAMFTAMGGNVEIAKYLASNIDCTGSASYAIEFFHKDAYDYFSQYKDERCFHHAAKVNNVLMMQELTGNHQGKDDYVFLVFISGLLFI